MIVWTHENLQPGTVVYVHLDAFLLNMPHAIEAEEPNARWLKRYRRGRLHTLILVATYVVGHMHFYTVPTDAAGNGYDVDVDGVLKLARKITHFVFVKFPRAAIQNDLAVDVEEYKSLAIELCSNILHLIEILQVYNDLYSGIPQYNTRAVWPWGNVARYRLDMTKLMNNVLDFDTGFGLLEIAIKMQEDANRVGPGLPRTGLRSLAPNAIVAVGKAVLRNGNYSMSQVMQRIQQNALPGVNLRQIGQYLRGCKRN